VNMLDSILVVIIIVGAVSGYQKGFLYSLFSLLAVFLGMLGGFKLMGIVMIKLSAYFEVDQQLLPYAAFGAVFLLIVVIVKLLGSLFQASLEKTLLGRADRLAGALLGALKTIFMVSVILWILDSLSFHIPGHWTEDSGLYEFTSNFAPETTNWAGKYVPAFYGLFKGGSE
jgi:membrane protein required for colicin V production